MVSKLDKYIDKYKWLNPHESFLCMYKQFSFMINNFFIIHLDTNTRPDPASSGSAGFSIEKPFRKLQKDLLNRFHAATLRKQISISFHSEWDMITVTVFEPNGISIWFKNHHHDLIPFTVKGNGNIDFSLGNRGFRFDFGPGCVPGYLKKILVFPGLIFL